MPYLRAYLLTRMENEKERKAMGERKKGAMSELELAVTLGIILEPENNYVSVNPLLISEILHLKQIFQLVDLQKKILGPVNPEMWCEFLPWYSMN